MRDVGTEGGAKGQVGFHRWEREEDGKLSPKTKKNWSWSLTTRQEGPSCSKSCSTCSWPVTPNHKSGRNLHNSKDSVFRTIYHFVPST